MRWKGNTDYGVVEERAVPQRGVRRDQVIFFYQLDKAGMQAYLRRIEFYE